MTSDRSAKLDDARRQTPSDVIATPLRGERTRPPLLAIIVGFTVAAVVQIGFVIAVADDLFTRALLGGLIAGFEVIGAIVFYRVLASSRGRGAQRHPGQGRRDRG